MSYDGFPHPPYPFTLLKGKKREGGKGKGKGRGGEKKKGKEISPKGGGRGENHLVSAC
jgi:hypothetical protein